MKGSDAMVVFTATTDASRSEKKIRNKTRSNGGVVWEVPWLLGEG
jgi:hypothetical protein